MHGRNDNKKLAVTKITTKTFVLFMGIDHKYSCCDLNQCQTGQCIVHSYKYE